MLLHYLRLTFSLNDMQICMYMFQLVSFIWNSQWKGLVFGLQSMYFPYMQYLCRMAHTHTHRWRYRRNGGMGIAYISTFLIYQKVLHIFLLWHLILIQSSNRIWDTYKRISYSWKFISMYPHIWYECQCIDSISILSWISLLYKMHKIPIYNIIKV